MFAEFHLKDWVCQLYGEGIGAGEGDGEHVRQEDTSDWVRAVICVSQAIYKVSVMKGDE